MDNMFMEEEVAKVGVDLKAEVLDALSTRIPMDGVDILLAVKKSIKIRVDEKKQEMLTRSNPFERMLGSFRVEIPGDFDLHYDGIIKCATALVAEGKAYQETGRIGIPVFIRN